METFESQSPSDKAAYLEYDETGKLRGNELDPEAQIMTKEFKHSPF